MVELRFGAVIIPRGGVILASAERPSEVALIDEDIRASAAFS